MTSLASQEMTEQEMINTCTAPQMAHLIQVLRQTIRNKDKEIEKWVDMVSQLQRDGELDPPEPKPKKGENMSNHNKETEARCPHCYRHYVEGERAWALYMMRMGHKVTNPMYDNRVYHLPEGGMIHVNGIESIATSQWIDYWCIDVPDGWQLYAEPEPEPEPKPEPPKEPEHTICKRCGGSQSVPSPEKEPEKESPIDPIERPLRSLILRAKEEGKNIRTYYQDMVFTPCALDGLLADGKFRWWNISNWELTSREQNYYPQISYDEPNPEPEYQVGDWVEHKESKEQATIRRIMSYGAIEIEFAYSTESDIYQANDFHNDFRKLSPSEVIVKIGCLEGTVIANKSFTYSDRDCFWLTSEFDSLLCSTIALGMLDTPTRELVESLLRAQEDK